MAKIFLLGAQGVTDLPQTVVDWVYAYHQQGHQFIVGDTHGDSNFHRLLSSIGAAGTSEIYCMDSPTVNKFNLPVKSFSTSYDEETKTAVITASDNSIEPVAIEGIGKVTEIANNREWYEFKDKLMISECALAILVIPEGEIQKRIDTIITRLNLRDKQCYVFRV